MSTAAVAAARATAPHGGLTAPDGQEEPAQLDGSGPLDVRAAREALARDGCLVFRGLLPAEEAEDLAGHIAAVLVRHGWAEGPPARLEPARPGWNPLTAVGADRAAFREICSLELLHRLAHLPPLMAAARALLEDDDVLVHPRPVARVVAPVRSTDQAPTPPHQDHVNMQGTPRALVAWAALTPCPRSAGALEIALGSRRGGPRPHATAAGAGVLTCATGPEDEWVAAELNPGDVLVFDALAVHRARPNRSRRFRLSVDVRYQRRVDPICELSLRAFGDLSWEEIYAGWQELPAGTPWRPRYWTGQSLRTVPHEPGRYRGDGAARATSRTLLP